jgi:hypothetical protein
MTVSWTAVPVRRTVHTPNPDEVRERRGVFHLGRSKVLVHIVLQVFIVDDIILGVDHLDFAQEAFPCCFCKGIGVALLNGRLGSKWMSA